MPEQNVIDILKKVQRIQIVAIDGQRFDGRAVQERVCAAGWSSTRSASISPATIFAPSTGTLPRAPAHRSSSGSAKERELTVMLWSMFRPRARSGRAISRNSNWSSKWPPCSCSRPLKEQLTVVKVRPARLCIESILARRAAARTTPIYHGSEVALTREGKNMRGTSLQLSLQHKTQAGTSV